MRAVRDDRTMASCERDRELNGIVYDVACVCVCTSFVSFCRSSMSNE